MNWLDIVIIAVIAVIALSGWKLGGIHLGVTGAGVLAGIALASRVHHRVTPLFSAYMDSDNGAEIAGFGTILILVLIAAIVVGFMVRTISRSLMLGWVDNVLGLALGVIVALAVGSTVFSAIQSYPVYAMDDTISDSTLAPLLADNFDTVLRGLKFIPTDLGTSARWRSNSDPGLEAFAPPAPFLTSLNPPVSYLWRAL